MIVATVVSKHNGAVFQALRMAIPDGIARGLADGGESVRMNAMSNILNGGHGLTGALADSIHYKEGRKGVNKVTGFVRTGALPQASTLEFGTGIYAENGAGSAPWFVHEDEAPDLSLYFDRYKRTDEFGNTVQTSFYRIVGAHPHPYLRPAANNTKDTVNRAVQNAVAAEIRGVIPR